MATQQDFYEAILDEPEDPVHRLVYADWLEENGAGPNATRLRFLTELPCLVADELGQRFLHGDRDSRPQRKATRGAAQLWAVLVGRLWAEDRRIIDWMSPAGRRLVTAKELLVCGAIDAAAAGRVHQEAWSDLSIAERGLASAQLGMAGFEKDRNRHICAQLALHIYTHQAGDSHTDPITDWASAVGERVRPAMPEGTPDVADLPEASLLGQMAWLADYLEGMLRSYGNRWPAPHPLGGT